MALRILFLGAPGAGKGTQARRICQSRGLAHIASGDIFRRHIAEKTDLGRRVEQSMAMGRLVSDDVACEVVLQRLDEPDCADGYLLDGFPRSIPQADRLGDWMEEQNTPLDAAISLDVPDTEIVLRLSARRQCTECGAVVNLRIAPAERPGCETPGCDGRLEPRRDDSEEVVRERLQIYHDTTEPLLAYYEARGMLRRVAGGGVSPDEVTSKIEAILRELQAAQAP